MNIVKTVLCIVIVLGLSACSSGSLTTASSDASTPSFLQAGKSYKVDFIASSTKDVTVLEIGSNGWIKVRFDPGTTKWLNIHAVEAIAEK